MGAKFPLAKRVRRTEKEAPGSGFSSRLQEKTHCLIGVGTILRNFHFFSVMHQPIETPAIVRFVIKIIKLKKL